MKFARFFAISLALYHISVSGVQAQVLTQDPVPAEFPPSSFSGTQYVDSEGCVFIRAGVDGAVTWVPRVTRDRRQVCGATPTLDPVQSVAQAPAPSSAERQVSSQAAPRASAPTVRRVAPRPVPAAAAAPVLVDPPVAAPQKAPPAAALDNRRILPSHLEASRTALNRVIVPEGFEMVWTDGRLNPKRGEQSVVGYKQSQTVLTLQVPRRAVGANGPTRIKEPRILSDEPIRTSQVEIIVVGAERR